MSQKKESRNMAPAGRPPSTQRKRAIEQHCLYTQKPQKNENVRKNLGTSTFFFERGAGLQHARCPAKPSDRHIVPMRLRNTPLWLYFRLVRSSEKSVKL